MHIMLSPELLTSSMESSLLAKGMDVQNLLEPCKGVLCFDSFCCGGFFSCFEDFFVLEAIITGYAYVEKNVIMRNKNNSSMLLISKYVTSMN